MNCRNCNQLINKLTRPVEYGFVDQCSECATDVEMYIGRRTDKHGDTEIFRDNIESIQKQINKENVVGFNANLPFDTADRDKKLKNEEG